MKKLSIFLVIALLIVTVSGCKKSENKPEYVTNSFVYEESSKNEELSSKEEGKNDTVTNESSKPDINYETESEYEVSTPEPYVFDIKKLPKFNIFKQEDNEAFVFSLIDIKAYDGHKVMQGGCFDGRYYYVVLIKTDVVPETCYIEKYDIKNGNKLVKRSEKLVLDHANDMTYVKSKNALLVSHCQSEDGHYNRYSYVDADTLTIKETHDLPHPFFAMDYCEKKNMFVSARWSGDEIDLWNGDLTHNKLIRVDKLLGTSQGICSDENYIYCVRYQPNMIYVYDWDGKLCYTVKLKNGNEPEHISIIDGVMFVGINNWNGGYFGYVELLDYSLVEGLQ